MNILLIDTSTTVEVVCARAGNTHASGSDVTGLAHSAGLIGRIDRCLGAAGVRPDGLDLLGTGIGPGSFTGIRIAVTTMRMFAQVLGLPLVGIPSPLIFAASAPARPGDYICVAEDARKGRVFGALYRSVEAVSPRVIVPPGDHRPADLFGAVPAGVKVVMIGGGYRAHGVNILHPGETVDEIAVLVPDPARTCALCEWLYLEEPGRWADYSRIVPDHARVSDAEAVRAGITFRD